MAYQKPLWILGELNTEQPSNAPSATKCKNTYLFKDLKAKDEVRSSFLVKSKDLLWNKNGKAT